MNIYRVHSGYQAAKRGYVTGLIENFSNPYTPTESVSMTDGLTLKVVNNSTYDTKYALIKL